MPPVESPKSTSPRRSLSTMEKAMKKIMSTLISSSSSSSSRNDGLDLNTTFIEKSFGLLLIAKSDQDSVFELLTRAVVSSRKHLRDQAHRALLRWALGNQRHRGDLYSVLAGKARSVSTKKVAIVVDYFRSLTESEGGDDVGGAARAMRAVSRSLLKLLEPRVGATTGPQSPPPAATVAPSDDEETKEERKWEIDGRIEVAPAASNRNLHDDEETKEERKWEIDGRIEVAPAASNRNLHDDEETKEETKWEIDGRIEVAPAASNRNLQQQQQQIEPVVEMLPSFSCTRSEIEILGAKKVGNALGVSQSRDDGEFIQLQATLSAGFEGIRSRQDAMERRLEQIERSFGEQLHELTEKLNSVIDSIAAGRVHASRHEASDAASGVPPTPTDIDGGGVAKTGKTSVIGGATVLELSEEERAMNGAPKDNIFQVTLKRSDELEASPDFKGEMEVISNVHRFVSRGTSVRWIELFAGVDSGRRLLIHHYPEAFAGDEEDRLPILGTLAVEAMKRPETNCARNGLFLMSEMFGSTGGALIHTDDMAGLVKEALRHAVSDKGFMFKAARATMDATVSKADKRALLAAVLPHCSSPNFKIAEEAVVYVTECVKRMTLEELDERRTGNLVEGLSRGLRGRQGDTRNAAAVGLKKVQDIMGKVAFEDVITAKLGESSDVSRDIRTAVTRAYHVSQKGKGKCTLGTGSGGSDKPWRKMKKSHGGGLAEIMRAGRAAKKEGVLVKDGCIDGDLGHADHQVCGLDSVFAVERKPLEPVRLDAAKGTMKELKVIDEDAVDFSVAGQKIEMSRGVVATMVADNSKPIV